MQWLFSRPRAPGIAWHTPTGEDAWLSVVFPLAGQIRGLQSNDIVNSKSQAFGSLLSQLGSASSLPNRIQLITRVQPVDTAMHESWVASEVDPDADRELLDSYREVVERLGRGSLMQRHFAVVRWPLTPAFLAEAERRAPAQRGWVMLMGEEIDAAHREMTSAGLGPGRALSAAQVGAVLRHQQLPSWPIDQARDIDPNNLWLPSKEEWPYVAVTGRVPSGEVETWLHRTAVVPIQHVNTSARGPLWMMPMLAQMRGRVVRTISVQLEGVPQSYARAQAREDFTSDLADEEAQRIKGRLVDDELVVGKHASKARVQDLKPGKPHQGLGWAIHVTVSATSRDELRGACRHMEEAAGKAGLDRLYWLDSYHAAAQACTWPLARGMKPSRTSAGAWMTGALAGTGHKEAL